MDKKYQVFISSTYIDLKEPRQKVMDTILALHQIPAGMEMFPAADDDQWTHIKTEIDKSDYYVLILGHRYGSMAPDGISWTEKEYDYARDQGIPVLAFIMNRDVPVRPSDLDDSATARKRLEKFAIKARSSKLCKFWNTPDELATQVSTSLAHSFATHPRVGWVRGNQAVSPEITEELLLLSKENRQLKAELEGLKKLNDKKPSIKLGFNVDEPIILQCKKLEHKFLSTPTEIVDSVDSIPTHLQAFVDQKSIDKYNSLIPEDIEKVTTYNKKLKLHNLVKSLGLELQLDITNDGSSKANNIYVDVEFPDSVLVLDGAKIDFPMPAVPPLTPNPIRRAESLFKTKVDGNSSSSIQSLLKRLNPDITQLSGSPFHSMASSRILNSVNGPRTFFTNLKENCIALVCADLLHTRMRTSNDIYTIVPRKPGEYEIKVSIICEEYSKTDEYRIPLIISEV